MRTPLRCSAFTLIEIMVVIVLIGILTAMILPEMKGTYDDVLLRSVSREIIGAVSVTSSRAVSFNQLHRLRIETRTGRYFSEKKVYDGNISGRFMPLKDFPGSEGKFDTRVTVNVRNSIIEPDDSGMSSLTDSDESLSEGEKSISFYPDGTAEAVEIHLKSPAGHRMALKINPISSRIEILDVDNLHP